MDTIKFKNGLTIKSERSSEIKAYGLDCFPIILEAEE